jgi:hypothetical protein
VARGERILGTAFEGGEGVLFRAPLPMSPDRDGGAFSRIGGAS